MKRPSREEIRRRLQEGPEVVVEEADAEPIDLKEWCDRYVAAVLELEGVKPPPTVLVPRRRFQEE